MKREQFTRANQRALSVCLIIVLSCALAFIVEGLSGGFSAGRIFELLACVASVIVMFLGYAMFNYGRKGATLIMLGATVTFVIIMLVECQVYYVVFGLPILISGIVYMNKKIIIGGSTVIVLMYIITVARTCIPKGGMDGESIMLGVATILAILACGQTRDLLNAFNTESMATIKEHTEAQE